MPSSAIEKMDSLLARRDEINLRIEKIRSNLGEIFMEQSRLNIAMRDAQDHLRGMPENNSVYAESRRGLVDKLQQVRDSLKHSEERRIALNEELVRLQTVDLPACVEGLYAEDVLEHYRQVDAARNEVSCIQAAIDAQHRLIADDLATIPGIPNREHERNDIMAEIALGKASREELDKLDAEIVKANQAIADAKQKVAPQIADAKATVAGLECKLLDAQEKHAAIQAKSAEVAHRYYVGIAQKAAAQYVNHALELKRLHFLLLGLNSIIHHHDGKGIVRFGLKAIQLPMFNLPQFDGLMPWPGNGQGMILDGDFIGYGDEINKIADEEKSKFEALIQRR